MLVTKTSARSSRRSIASWPASLRRSSTTLRLPRLSSSNGGTDVCSRAPTAPKMERCGSPAADSTLTTSAPQSASTPAAAGPATHAVSSTTRTPSRIMGRSLRVALGSGSVVGQRAASPPGTVARVSDEPAPTDAVAFPELTDQQLAAVTALGQRRTVRAGEVLFSPADDHYDFVVMLTATLDVLGPDGVVIATHGPRRFLGEVSLVSRQRPYLTSRVAAPGDVVVVPADVFRARVLTDPVLSDTVLEAFLAR